jgi:hypothetical protein
MATALSWSTKVKNINTEQETYSQTIVDLKMTFTKEFEMVERNSTTDFEQKHDEVDSSELLHILHPQKQRIQEQLETGSSSSHTTITSKSMEIEEMCEETDNIEPTLPILPPQQQLEATSQNTFTSSPLVEREQISETEGGMTHSGTYLMLT